MSELGKTFKIYGFESWQENHLWDLFSQTTLMPPSHRYITAAVVRHFSDEIIPSLKCLREERDKARKRLRDRSTLMSSLYR